MEQEPKNPAQKQEQEEVPNFLDTPEETNGDRLARLKREKEEARNNGRYDEVKALEGQIKDLEHTLDH